MPYNAPSQAAIDISNLVNSIANAEAAHKVFLQLIAANPLPVNLKEGMGITPNGDTLRTRAGGYFAEAHPRPVIVDNSALMEYAFDVLRGDDVVNVGIFYLSQNGRVFILEDDGSRTFIGDTQQPEVVGHILASVQLAVLTSELFAIRG